MILRYFRALFIGEKTVEFYWNAAGAAGGLLLLGSVLADQENYDLLFKQQSSPGGTGTGLGDESGGRDGEGVKSKGVKNGNNSNIMIGDTTGLIEKKDEKKMNRKDLVINNPLDSRKNCDGKE